MTDLAREYGMGMYELAREENILEEIHDQLRMVDDCFEQNPDFLSLLNAASIPLAERFSVLEDVLSGRVHQYIVNFIKILMRRGAIHSFKECVQVYHVQFNKDFGLCEAKVVSAAPLNRKSAEALRAKLEEISGKHIILIEEVDASLLGGLRVEMEGHRMDNSIQSRVENLRRVLVEDA